MGIYDQKVYDFLTMIPKGKVVTYGMIARYLGNVRLSRVVGTILHKNPDPTLYPCFKVVNAQGKLTENFAFFGIDHQKHLLEQDGVEVINYQVDLEKYLWRL